MMLTKEEEIKYFENKLAERQTIADPKKYTNFKVTFKMSSPICLTFPFLFVDALIGHLILLETLGREFFITDKKINLSKYMPKGKMPFGTSFVNGITVPNISVAVMDCDEFFSETIYKRFEDRFVEFGGKIRNNSGYFKSYMMKHIYIPATEVTAYILGDLEIIKGLFERNLFGLGNDIRLGYGMIKEMTFEPMQKNFSLVKDGICMRPIPIEFCKEYEEAELFPHKAPYWARTNMRLCTVPFTKVRLIDDIARYHG